MPDNREIAALVWLGAAALWVLSQQELRASLGGVFKAFLQPLIVIPLAVMLAWIGLELWVGARLALWNVTLAKSTLLWTLGSAAVLFFNCTQAASDQRFFQRTMVATIGVAVFVEFFMNLYVMSLPAELVLQFAVIVLSLLATVGGIKPEHRPAKILCEVLLAAIGFALFAHLVATDLPFYALLLAYSPGGVAEMSLVALALGIDIAMVATHHLFRLFFVLVPAPQMFRLWRRLAAK